jgi:hypothetical protein
MRSAALMAQNHEHQDNPSPSDAKAFIGGRAEGALPLRAAEGPSGIALAGLGTNAWLTCVGWVLISNDVSAPQAGVSAAGLLPLWLGTLLRAHAHTPARWTGVRWLLLGIFPFTLAAALCLGTEATRERAHSALSMLLAAASLLAYGAAALQACRTPLPLLPTRSHARRSERSTRPAASVGPLRVAAALLWVGAFAIALVAPLSTDYATLQQAWGESADAGATFTAVVAGSIAATLLGMDLGPLLKARRASHVSLRTRRNRIATLLFLTLCGGFVYLALLH